MFRASLERDDLQGASRAVLSAPAQPLAPANSLPPVRAVVAINHTAPNLRTFIYSIKYDSTHGHLKQADELSVDEDNNCLYFRGRKIALFSERDPLKLDWKSAGAEYIVEATGKHCTTATAGLHLKAGAKKVVISAPAKDTETKTIVVGVNRKEYKPDMDVVSNASCTVRLRALRPLTANPDLALRRPTASPLSPRFSTTPLASRPA